MKNMELHSFYCMNCGEKTYELMRPKSHKYGKHHRKALYCPHCRQTLNCIECRNDAEVFEFKEAFNAGEYVEEAAESINHTSIKNKLELLNL